MLVAKLVILGILSSIFLILALYTLFLTTFFTKSLSLLKWTVTGANLSTSNSYILLLNFLKSLGTLFNFSMSNLSTSNFELAKSVFLAKSNVLNFVA